MAMGFENLGEKLQVKIIDMQNLESFNFRGWKIICKFWRRMD
jgi:hypothetical protein